jgi:DNA-binding transcriptional MerR regulator
LTLLERLAEIIRGWQLKGYSNEEISKMVEHPAFKSAQNVVKAQPRKNGHGDWVM